MQIQPEQIGIKLLERVIDLMEDPALLNEFDAKYIRRNAEKLIEKWPSQAYMILACLSFLEHKTEDMIDYHERSLDYSDSDYVALMNYAVSMNNSGRHQKAFELIEKVVELRGGTDIKAVQWACDYSLSAGLLKKSLHYAECLDKLNSPLKDKKDIERMISICEHHGCSDEDIEKYFSLVTDVMASFDVYTSMKSQWKTPDSEIVCEFFVSTTPDIAAKMNDRLSELMASINVPVALMLDICCVFTSDANLQMKKLVDHND